MEASGEHCLTAYQACSVETASKTNPKRNILIYMCGKESSSIASIESVKQNGNTYNKINFNAIF